jgi:aspartate aminotransferase
MASSISRWAAENALGVADGAIRRMFELGARLRRESSDPVYDLSLGNPHLEPPECWRQAVIDLLEDEPPGQHRYMPNAGFPAVREFIAQREAERFGLPVTPDDVIMTVGAAGGLAITLRTLLDPGDDVIVPAPYFTEYAHYCRLVGARLVAVPTAPDFRLDLGAIEAALTANTRIVLVNSPNNPTGAVYENEDLAALAALLQRASSRRSRELYVVEDSPYRDLVFEGPPAASLMSHYAETVHVTSHSKDLGLAGERIGHVVISPRAAGRSQLQRALPFANRVLGFVNAPALMQRALMRVLGTPGGRVDVTAYASNARALAAGLGELGFEVVTPRGGMFLFPRLPQAWIANFGESADIEFADRLAKRRALVVPGAAFGRSGHLRVALSVPSSEVTGALAAFRAECQAFDPDPKRAPGGHFGAAAPSTLPRIE